MTLNDLLVKPPSPSSARTILRYVRELPGRVMRGDMQIGILSVDEIEQVPVALERAASTGEPMAWLDLARWHARPPFGEADLMGMERALSAARGLRVPGANLETVRLRWFYRREDASPAEQAETYRLARQLSDDNPQDAEAAYYLGLLTCQGFGTSATPGTAVELQRLAASLGNTDAMFELYVHYETGLGVPVDHAKALEYIRSAAHKGHPRAMYNMGAFCATGRGLPKNAEEAVVWYQRAYEVGSLPATATLAVMYARGEGIAQDTEHARALFEEAEYRGYDTEPFRELVGL